MIALRRALIAGSLAASASIVAYFEGERLTTYLDPVGIPTICYGHTGTAVMGQTKTLGQCRDLLSEDLGWAMAEVDKHLPDAPPMVRAAFGSFTYNVGVGAFRSSTLLRKAKAGDLQGACNELPRWKHAGGRVLPGLVTRRATERELCLSGLK